jgi:hypothetical protein
MAPRGGHRRADSFLPAFTSMARPRRRTSRSRTPQFRRWLFRYRSCAHRVSTSPAHRSVPSRESRVWPCSRRLWSRRRSAIAVSDDQRGSVDVLRCRFGHCSMRDIDRAQYVFALVRLRRTGVDNHDILSRFQRNLQVPRIGLESQLVFIVPQLLVLYWRELCSDDPAPVFSRHWRPVHLDGFDADAEVIRNLCVFTALQANGGTYELPQRFRRFPREHDRQRYTGSGR